MTNPKNKSTANNEEIAKLPDKVVVGLFGEKDPKTADEPTEKGDVGEQEVDYKEIIVGLYRTISSFNNRLIDFKIDVNEQIADKIDELKASFNNKIEPNPEKDDNNSMIDYEIEKKLNKIEEDVLTIKNKPALSITFQVFLGLVLTALAISIPLAMLSANNKMEALDTKIESKFDQINTSINKNMELINQKLDSQKEINSLQIQRDVKDEVSKQLKK